jgi:hypothetical protein
MNIPGWLLVPFFIVNFCWIITIVSIAYIREKRNPMFSDRFDVDFVFEERKASGNSDKSWFSKIGGASRCLTIRVTDTELWVSTPDIFAFINKYGDLKHRVPIVDIVDMQSDQKDRVHVSFYVNEQKKRSSDTLLDCEETFALDGHD